jgi:hypothetical protein
MSLDQTPYRQERMFGPEYHDLYVIDVATGERESGRSPSRRRNSSNFLLTGRVSTSPEQAVMPSAANHCTPFAYPRVWGRPAVPLDLRRGIICLVQAPGRLLRFLHSSSTRPIRRALNPMRSSYPCVDMSTG